MSSTVLLTLMRPDWPHHWALQYITLALQPGSSAEQQQQQQDQTAGTRSQAKRAHLWESKVLKSEPRGWRLDPSKASRELKGNGTWGAVYLRGTHALWSHQQGMR